MPTQEHHACNVGIGSVHVNYHIYSLEANFSMEVTEEQTAQCPVVHAHQILDTFKVTTFSFET